MALLTTCFSLIAASAQAPQQSLFPGTTGQALVDSLVANYSPNQTLGYGPARDSLYTYENETDGSLIGVYSGFSIVLDPTADASTDAANKGVNAEHSWPQSMGAADEPQKSDLHHIFPARSQVNSARSNHPFGRVNDTEADAWYRLTDSQSTIPTNNLDEWSERDNTHPNPLYAARFEPREDHKGNAARAMFYFYLIYQPAADAADPNFFEVQKDDLLRWAALDLVDMEEYDRDGYIGSLQGNSNPFILDTTLVRRVYGDPAPGSGPGSGGVTTNVWVNEFHYDNSSTDVNEGVEIAGPAGGDLSGWTLELYNGSGGVSYTTIPLTGEFPDQQSGFGTLWFDVSGMQNGGPDGFALVDEMGTVVQFISYEGTFSAVDGSAQGETSTDVGVWETSSTQVDYSLQLGGAGNQYADFAWDVPTPASRGSFGASQTILPPDIAWINELHYDNAGNDRNEGLEIAGTSGLDLTDWQVVAYNGSNGLVYGEESLSGSLPSDASGISTVWVPFAGLQNGIADGLALVDADDMVVQFLSYEGVLTATDGPAIGMISVDIGVSEGSTAKNRTLQLTGTGMMYSDFSWVAQELQTRGAVNVGQAFDESTSRQASTVGREEDGADGRIEIQAVYPNPARGYFSLSVVTDEAMLVTVALYDLRGRRVGSLRESWVNAGSNDLIVETAQLSAGVYVYSVESQHGGVERGRVVVVR